MEEEVPDSHTEAREEERLDLDTANVRAPMWRGGRTGTTARKNKERRRLVMCGWLCEAIDLACVGE